MMAIFSFQVLCPLQESAKRKMIPATIHHSLCILEGCKLYSPQKKTHFKAKNDLKSGANIGFA